MLRSMKPRVRLAIAVAGVALVAAIISTCAPLRMPSGDTVPGRIGGAVLRCAGSFDLDYVDWVKKETSRGRIWYWLEPDWADEFTSVYGPVPAILDAIALLDFGEGDTISDDTLRRRERGAAAVLLGLATALFILAAAAKTKPTHATIAGVVAMSSFAGAATMGQGMWQATGSLPVVCGALATFAWRERFPILRYATPALLALAAMMRPTIAPLLGGIGLAWAFEIGSPLKHKRTWIIAAAAALALCAPLAIWNFIHYQTGWPVAQLHANQRVATAGVFSAKNFVEGFAGLLVSPARGLLWYAPIALVGVIFGLRTRGLRLIAVGVILQILVIATFRAWHGGQAYGPRFLAEAAWIGIWLAAIVVAQWKSRIALGGVAAAALVTIVVGQLGLWKWQPEQWEIRLRPETHPAAWWFVRDNPISSTFDDVPISKKMHDSVPKHQWTCTNGTLVTK
jgi:hypothetical protein